MTWNQVKGVLAFGVGSSMTGIITWLSGGVPDQPIEWPFFGLVVAAFWIPMGIWISEQH